MIATTVQWLNTMLDEMERHCHSPYQATTRGFTGNNHDQELLFIPYLPETHLNEFSHWENKSAPIGGLGEWVLRITLQQERFRLQWKPQEIFDHQATAC